MGCMALLMLIIFLWAVGVLAAHTNIFSGVKVTEKARQNAMFMLLTLPIGLFLVLGGVIFWRDLKKLNKNDPNNPAGRRP